MVNGIVFVFIKFNNDFFINRWHTSRRFCGFPFKFQFTSNLKATNFLKLLTKVENQLNLKKNDFCKLLLSNLTSIEKYIQMKEIKNRKQHHILLSILNGFIMSGRLFHLLTLQNPYLHKKKEFKAFCKSVFS